MPKLNTSVRITESVVNGMLPLIPVSNGLRVALNRAGTQPWM